MRSRMLCWGLCRRGISGRFFRRRMSGGRVRRRACSCGTALEEIHTAGYRIVNVDTVLVMMRPKIVPIAGDLRQSVAELLGVKPGDVGIKAKTPEGLNQDGVAVAHATVLLESIEPTDTVKVMTATADVDEVNEVVDSLLTGVRDVSALGRKVPAFDTDDLT